MTIGEQLSAARKIRGLTQQQVADQLHVTRQAISNWEVGRSYPDVASLIILSDLFVLSLDQLLKEDGKMIDDLKLKERERKAARTMFWGSWLVNAALVVVLMLEAFKVPGATFGWLVALILPLIVIMNVIVMMAASQRYEKMKSKPAARISKMSKPVIWVLAMSGFTLGVSFGFFGATWFFAGITTGVLVGDGVLLAAMHRFAQPK